MTGRRSWEQERWDGDGPEAANQNRDLDKDSEEVRGIFQQTGVSLCENLPLKMEKVILGLQISDL